MDVPAQELEREPSAFNEVGFTCLLEWLDDGTESHGATYLEIRRRLVSYFDRRNRPAADELADETLNRITRTLETSGSIAVTPPARYCYVVARFVLLEDVRHGRRSVQFDEARDSSSFEAGGPPAEALDRERRSDCLDNCLLKLQPEQRELIVEYYRDAKRQRIDHRRDLAAALGISMNALGIRACRIRATLETCVTGCANSA